MVNFFRAKLIELTARVLTGRAAARWREWRGEGKCLQYYPGTMDETPKKPSNATVKICRCCNAKLSNIYDRIDLFGKTAEKENVIEKLKEMGRIEVLEEDVDFLPTKICRKCFRKVTGIAKAVYDFRKICSQSKEIQIEDMDNARLKRGRKPSSLTQGPQGKRRSVPTEFTTQHFNNNTLTPDDQSAHEECSTQSRVRMSLFPPGEQSPPHTREILPLPAVAIENASRPDEEVNKPKASDILKDAGLRNPEVGVIIFYLI